MKMNSFQLLICFFFSFGAAKGAKPTFNKE